MKTAHNIILFFFFGGAGRLRKINIVFLDKLSNNFSYGKKDDDLTRDERNSVVLTQCVSNEQQFENNKEYKIR